MGGSSGGGRAFGLPDDEPQRPANLPPREESIPRFHPPNQADAPWVEIEELRAEAQRLGVPVNPNWPLIILREQVAAAKAK